MQRESPRSYSERGLYFLFCNTEYYFLYESS